MLTEKQIVNGNVFTCYQVSIDYLRQVNKREWLSKNKVTHFYLPRFGETQVQVRTPGKLTIASDGDWIVTVGDFCCLVGNDIYRKMFPKDGGIYKEVV